MMQAVFSFPEPHPEINDFFPAGWRYEDHRDRAGRRTWYLFVGDTKVARFEQGDTTYSITVAEHMSNRKEIVNKVVREAFEALEEAHDDWLTRRNAFYRDQGVRAREAVKAAGDAALDAWAASARVAE